jgi:ubiquitin-conjugating enzyme E2 G1
MASGAALLLRNQYKLMQSKDSIEGISVGLVDDNVFEWEVMLMISDECKFYGGTTTETRSTGPLSGLSSQY